jgi:predicted GNAT family N-acyltransferase
LPGNRVLWDGVPRVMRRLFCLLAALLVVLVAANSTGAGVERGSAEFDRVCATHAEGAEPASDLHRAALAAAGARGFTELRLFVAAGQARARRFYEREGWLAAGDPFDDPVPGLTMIEYRCTLSLR